MENKIVVLTNIFRCKNFNCIAKIAPNLFWLSSFIESALLNTSVSSANVFPKCEGGSVDIEKYRIRRGFPPSPQG